MREVRGSDLDPETGYADVMYVYMCTYIYIYIRTYIHTVGYATRKTNDATTNEFYNETFLSIKSGCYNERGGILSDEVAFACA
jgi:hypothetical protein